MQVVLAAISEVHFAMNDIGVRPRRGAMKRPLKFAEGNRQAGQSDVALGARIAQALGFRGQMRCHLGQQIRLIELESFTQLEFAAIGPRHRECRVEK